MWKDCGSICTPSEVFRSMHGSSDAPTMVPVHAAPVGPTTRTYSLLVSA